MMPPREKTGVPGDVALAHFHSSTISGSAWCMIARTFASVLPRQSPSSLILASIEVDPTETVFFILKSSHSRSYFNRAQGNLLTSLAVLPPVFRSSLDATGDHQPLI